MSTNNIKLFGNTPLESASNYLSDFVKGKLIIAKDMNLALRNATIGSYTFFNILKDYGSFTIGPELTNDEINTQTTKIKQAFEAYVDNLIEKKVADDIRAGVISTEYNVNYSVKKNAVDEGILTTVRIDDFFNKLSSTIENRNKLVVTPCLLNDNKPFPMPRFTSIGANTSTAKIASETFEFNDDQLNLSHTFNKGETLYPCNGDEKELMLQLLYYVNPSTTSTLNENVQNAIDNMGILTFHFMTNSWVSNAKVIGTGLNGYRSKTYQCTQEIAHGELKDAPNFKFKIVTNITFEERIPIYASRYPKTDGARPTIYRVNTSVVLETYKTTGSGTLVTFEEINTKLTKVMSINFKSINTQSVTTSI